MELLRNQTCPFCDDEVEDCYAQWEDTAEIVVCDSCHKSYVVQPQYRFEGFEIHKMCDECGLIEEECLCEEEDK